ncbi:MAG: anthranilate synthase component I family protein [Gemmatimonadaceae bacterium]|nr:anthranilate synthase component I family protein [Gemmatimonadaceae bacterium]
MTSRTETDFSRFEQLARSAASSAPGRTVVVPVWKDILLDTETPVSAFAKLRRGQFAFLLESAPAGSETWARYTFLGTEPRAAWRLTGGEVEDWTAASGWHNARRPADPLADLDALVSASVPAEAPELGAFWNGAVGFFGYDVVRLIERLPNAPPRASGVPDALFMFTRAVVVIDNLRSQARIVVGVTVQPRAPAGTLRAAHREALGEIAELDDRLRAPARLGPLTLDAEAPAAAGRSSIEKSEFLDKVEKIREYIRAGDCFQALLARRIELDADFEPLSLYRALRALNPSPYMYHLVLDGVDIVGSSPELLVRLTGNRVTLRPIAGTRPRGATRERDEELTAELLADPKERAEHIMLVDLARNDVGRVSKYGSVEVSELMTVERYSHVLHIVSEVGGEVSDSHSAMDVFRATFPAGTMTGAPKVRAMQIIDELEPVARGPYAGAIGYIAGGGRRMDLAITIRTCVIADGLASVQVGAGIVSDSVAGREWEETESKARAVLSAIAQVRGRR